MKLWLLFFLGIPTLSFAQTLGGNGHGSKSQKSSLMLLTGSTNFLNFLGGNGNGSNKGASGNISLSGGQPNLNSLGGKGHGASTSRTSTITLFGQAISFKGGNGGGSSRIISGIISLSGENRNSNIDFKGGNGGGTFRATTVSLYLNGNNLSSSLTFAGGSGNGSARGRSPKDIFLTGIVFSPPFTGGPGRGDRSLRSSRLTLAGVLVPSAVRIAQSSIVDFYHIPDHLNKKAHVKISLQTENQLEKVVLQHFLSGKGFVNHSQVDIKNSSEAFFDLPIDLKNDFQTFRFLEVFKDSSSILSNQFDIEPLNNNSKLYAFPNPATESVELTSLNSESLETIQVIDLQGRIMDCPVHFGMNGKANIKVNNLKEGLYTLKVSLGQRSESIRFAKK